MKILIITGSISERSMNKRIARYLETTYGAEHDVTHFDLKSIPMYNQDEEGNPPQVILDMRAQFDESDAIVLVTPEYNHSVPGVLKNMIDWGSRGKRVFKDKPVLLIGASQGKFASIRAQTHLIQILASPGVEAKRFPTQIMIGEVQNLFDAEGNCQNSDTTAFITDTMDKFLAFAAE